jgi:hypothetical protein
MTNKTKPHFIIKNNFQKRNEHYSDILTSDILKDICQLTTGCAEYTYEFLDEVNVGRLVLLKYRGKIIYISLSEDSIEGRNSSFQSLPSAIVRYYLDKNKDKEMCFYFLPSKGNYDTPYFVFMYRLMMTAGVSFLNGNDTLLKKIHPFNSIQDMIATRDFNKSRNRSNNSTYITVSSSDVVQIYGKTYGASKKETTLLCIALSRISTSKIELYEISEQNLTQLPKKDLMVIQSLGMVEIIPTDMTLERNEFEKENSLRSPRFTYNLLSKLGPKKCTFCSCEIPELIQGAHIWPVAYIKRQPGLSIESKIKYATDGDNGLWLCENHHKLLDNGLININMFGKVTYRSRLDAKSQDFIQLSTPIKQIAQIYMTKTLIEYIGRRNKSEG